MIAKTKSSKMGSNTPITHESSSSLLDIDLRIWFLVSVFREPSRTAGRPPPPERSAGISFVAYRPRGAFGAGGHAFSPQHCAVKGTEVCATAAPDVRLTVAPENSTVAATAVASVIASDVFIFHSC